MIYSTCFGVLLLLAATFGEIYFEEDFQDDSWRQRWIIPTFSGINSKKIERSTVTFYGGANNTGLRFVGLGADKYFVLSNRFNPIGSENKTLVVQFSIKYGRNTSSGEASMKLYGCNFPSTEIHQDTPHVLEFGSYSQPPWKTVELKAENLWGQSIESSMEVPLDAYTHVYTLILRPNQSYEMLFDDGTIFRKSANLVENQNGSRNISTMLPDVCGIGFYISQDNWDTILDNILLSDNVSIAKRKRDDIFAEMVHKTRYKFGGTSILVDITAADLTKILDSKRKFELRKDNHTHLIFEDFDKFLVPFDLSNNNTAILATAEYNRLRGASNVTIQLWVSFQPRNENILDDLDSVLKLVIEANSIAPKTVTTIVISYGFLQLDQESLSFVNKELREVSIKVKSFPVQHFDLGLQISDINCRGTRHYAKYLETNLLDFFLLMPMPQTKHFNPSHVNDKKFASCVRTANLVEIAVAPLVHSYKSVEIDFEQGVYLYNKTFVHKHSNLYLSALALIRTGDKIRKDDEDMVDTEQLPKYKNLVNWLYQRTDFSKSHFGAVISWKDIKLMGSKNFAATILQNFNHIMINISNQDDFETENHLEAIVEEIAHYSLLVKKYEESVGNHIPKDNTQIQISILVTIESNDAEVNKRQADRVFSVARNGNAISSGSVETIFIDWLECGRSKVCSWSSQTDLEMVCLHAERLRNLTNILSYAFSDSRTAMQNRRENESFVWFGSVEDEWFEELQREYKDKQCVGDSYPYRLGYPALCKVILLHENIAKYGGLKAYKMVIESFSFCLYSQEYFGYTYFYVNVVGCVDGHSNMTLLVEYTTLMENLSKWAAVEYIILFINAGVEPSKCTEHWRSSEKEGCECGWWIKQESDESYRDKKLVARQLYEKAKADEEKLKTRVPKESRLWLWILIPVIIFGSLFTIPAVFLVLHYRSKCILTKREVDEFIQGRQTTRAEQVEEGDEVAETQSYNSQKYELSPSTFTVDVTSSCLGSGEYARVYRGSIRREGAVLEAAVKMANTNLVQKSHGYYLALKGLLSEIKILAYVGEHKHIVSLLGAYTKKVRKGEIAVFLELCQLGSLDKYLHAIKPQIIDDCASSSNGKSDSDASLMDEEENGREKIQVLDKESSEDLFRWAGEIASGMEFLASKKLVHADLAARNVLLTSEKIAKISDFGLSRRLYDYTEYVKQNQAPLPWRWMAPESLYRMFFSEKTDVWAFGVTLWEMFTLGDQPYPGLSWTTNFSVLLEGGLRLPEPRFNSNEIYSVMLRCWDISPSMRPSFSQLKSELNSN